MLVLNLLPPEQKEAFEWEKNRRFAIFNAAVFFLFLVFFAGLLASSIFYVRIQFEPLKEAIARERLREETRKAEDLKAQVQGVITKLEQLRSIQGNRDNTLFFLREFANLPHSGVAVTSMTMQEASPDRSAGKNVRVSGHAGTRDQLIAFENSIKTDPYFENLVSPSFPNKTKETDIDFTLTFIFVPSL